VPVIVLVVTGVSQNGPSEEIVIPVPDPVDAGTEVAPVRNVRDLQVDRFKVLVVDAWRRLADGKIPRVVQDVLTPVEAQYETVAVGDIVGRSGVDIVEGRLGFRRKAPEPSSAGSARAARIAVRISYAIAERALI